MSFVQLEKKQVKKEVTPSLKKVCMKPVYVVDVVRVM